MEMTARRMAVIALGAFALLLVARPPRPTGTPYAVRRLKLLSAAEQAKRTFDASNDTLRALEVAIAAQKVRDAATRTLALIPASARNQLVVDPRVPASLRLHMQAVYAATRSKMGTEIALPVFVSVDTAAISSSGRTLWIDNAVSGVPTCATIVRVQTALLEADDARKVVHRIIATLGAGFPQPKHLGLCSFEAAFGAPSPTVRRWLRERAYAPVSGGLGGTVRPAFPFYLGRSGGIEFPYYWYGSDNEELLLKAFACTAGRLQWCTEAAAPVVTQRLLVEVDGASDWSYRWWWGWRGSPDLMNALATQMGPARFAELWRADEAPAAAYQRIMRVPMDSLAQRVMLREQKPLRAGAAPLPGEALAALLVALGFAGLSMLSHPRRRNL